MTSKQIQWFPGHMFKSLREIKEKVKFFPGASVPASAAGERIDGRVSAVPVSDSAPRESP